MENNFNQDNFEEFLQNQLRNHRMYPKDAVWRDIHHKLHGEKRWPALTIASVFLIGITTFICLHFSPKQNIFSIKPVLEPLQKASTPVADVEGLPTRHLGLPTFNVAVLHDAPSAPLTDNKLVAVLAEESSLDAAAEESKDHEIVIDNQEKTLQPKQLTMSQDVSLSSTMPERLLENEKSVAGDKPLNSSTAAFLKAANITSGLPLAKEYVAPVDVAINEEKKPSLIERFKGSKKPGKFNILFYMAPSISYRKLVEDRYVLSKTSNEGPVGVNQVADVNDVVRHKPSKGLEAGLSLLYDLTKTIRIKTGFQFNVRQYTIDAYKSNTEVSSIALIEDNRIDTINTVASYRNYNGNYSAELLNRYYQISMPLGIEWEVLGNKRFQLNIAGSIQPTFIVNRNAYLLTTNFKNYTEKGEMVRKWNLNSNLEAFVTMNVGDFKWQLGPQIRYQPYSTFIKQYPIKEHLIDYGIKLGVSTRIK